MHCPAISRRLGIVSRVFRGTFGPQVHSDSALQLASTRRPLIRIIILIGRERFTRYFLIDTGADFTIVQPDLARPLLRAAGRQSAASGDRNTITLNGVGPTSLSCLVQPAGLSLVDESGSEFVFPAPVLIPQIDGRSESGRSNGVVPSLLGRDVLRQFDFQLSYDPPNVSLILND